MATGSSFFVTEFISCYLGILYGSIPIDDDTLPKLYSNGKLLLDWDPRMHHQALVILDNDEMMRQVFFHCASSTGLDLKKSSLEICCLWLRVQVFCDRIYIVLPWDII
jgi:hypothetical protein